MRMRGLWVVGVAALLAACPAPAPVDDPDAQPEDDGGGGTGGLTVRFTSEQDVPGPTAPDRSLEEVDFRAYSLTVVGDSGNQTRMEVRIRWHDGDDPELIRFEDAPPGIYSSLQIRLLGDGEDDGYEITGDVEIEDMQHSFDLTGEDLPPITIPIEAFLPAGGSVTITVPVALASIINELDFTQCTPVGEELDCDVLGDLVDDRVIAAFAPDGADAGPSPD
jgi:hypothetical protein